LVLTSVAHAMPVSDIVTAVGALASAKVSLKKDMAMRPHGCSSLVVPSAAVVVTSGAQSATFGSDADAAKVPASCVSERDFTYRRWF